MVHRCEASHSPNCYRVVATFMKLVRITLAPIGGRWSGCLREAHTAGLFSDYLSACP